LDRYSEISGEKQRTALSQMMRTEAAFLHCSTERKSPIVADFGLDELRRPKSAKKELHRSSLLFSMVFSGTHGQILLQPRPLQITLL
jgi:hypothetical protein